jgi:hypothetical protein
MNAIRGAIAFSFPLVSLVAGWQLPLQAQAHLATPVLDIPRASERFLEEGREQFEAEIQRLTQGQNTPTPDLLQGEEAIDIQEELRPLEEREFRSAPLSFRSHLPSNTFKKALAQ